MSNSFNIATISEMPKNYASSVVVLPYETPFRPSGPICLDDIDNKSILNAHFGSPAGFQVDCFFSSDIAVSGHGLLWIGDQVIVDPGVMPTYWLDRLTGHALSSAEIDVHLPVRDISGPCICALGWGASTVYGHLLIEAVPRILTALRATKDSSPRVLIRNDAPQWQKSILYKVGIQDEQFVTFEPDKERVRLKEGIFPSYAYRNAFHPGVSDLIDSAFGRPAEDTPRSGLVYISRLGHYNSGRHCENEKELVEIAKSDFGAEIIEPEGLSWDEQVQLFSRAKQIIGLYGSGLHTALFSRPGLDLGVVGVVNNVQAHICAVRDQRIGYMIKDIRLVGGFSINPDAFRKLGQEILNAR